MHWIPHIGLNSHKEVENFKNYRPNIVPVEFQSDELYAKLSEDVREQIDRSEFWQKMKAKIYTDGKDRTESLVFDNEEGKA